MTPYQISMTKTDFIRQGICGTSTYCYTLSPDSCSPGNGRHNESHDPESNGCREADGQLFQGEKLGAFPAVEGQDDPEQDVEDGVQDDVQDEVATDPGSVR